ncbi:MAG: GNAT family N-acetyltransferase [Actinomycetota bacterium]
MTTWNPDCFELPTVAEAVGPFGTAPFLEAVTEFDSGVPLPAVGEDTFLPLLRQDQEVVFAGHPDLTDYHTPFGERSDALIAAVAAEVSPARFRLDSLPQEAAKPLVAGLEEGGWRVETGVHEVTAVLDLPESFDTYLADVGKKERHEIRRKRRRYERAVDPIVHETHAGEGWALEEFFRLHRLSQGEKGRFLTEERRQLFTRLAGIEGWRLDVLRTEDGGAAAVVFGYSDPTGYYLYNSAYDPSLREGSPGVVLLGSMIEKAISEDMPRFDFLKGDEAYKFRLGARRRPLMEIVARPGAAQ